MDDDDTDANDQNFAASSTEGSDDNSEILEISNEEVRLRFGTPHPTNFTLQMADMLPSKTIPINSKVHARVLKAKAKATTAPQDDNTPRDVSSKPSLSRATTLSSESSFQNHPPKVRSFNLTSRVFLPKPGIQITKSTKKSPIYLFYENVANGPDGTPGDEGDVHYRCLHGSHKVCTIKRSMKSNVNGESYILIAYHSLQTNAFNSAS
jgi:hypothetical protein